MSAQNIPDPEGGGKKVKGTAYTTDTGERRIRLVDLKKINKYQEEDVYSVKLSDIILGGVTFEGEDGKEVRLCPINMKGMAMLERLMDGNLKALAGGDMDLTTTISIATILVNQDLPLSEHVTDDEIGRMMIPQIMEVVNNLIAEMVRPLFAPEEADSLMNPEVVKGA